MAGDDDEDPRPQQIPQEDPVEILEPEPLAIAAGSDGGGGDAGSPTPEVVTAPDSGGEPSDHGAGEGGGGGYSGSPSSAVDPAPNPPPMTIRFFNSSRRSPALAAGDGVGDAGAPSSAVDSAPNAPPPTRLPAAPRRSSAHGGKRRKKPLLNKKQMAQLEKTLDDLRRKLRLVPFSPPSRVAADLSPHERLLRAIGLWEFIHMEFDRELRPDLLHQLIASYDQKEHKGCVMDLRVSIRRGDVCKALGILPKKEVVFDPDMEVGEDGVAAVCSVMSGWMLLLQDKDDGPWILPDAVVEATKLVKEGKPHKVDWGKLVFDLLEKDLVDCRTTGECYFASHLQCLLRHQKPKLFEESAGADVEMDPELEPEGENCVEVLPCGPVEARDGDPVEARDGDLDRVGSPEGFSVENQGPGLSLGIGLDVDMVNGVDESLDEDEDEQSQQFGKDSGVDHCLRRCNMSDVRSMECEDMTKRGSEGIGREEEGYSNDLSKYADFDTLGSTDLLHAMESDIPYGSQSHSLDQTSGEFLTMGHDMAKSVMLHHPSNSLFFGNGCKRQIDEVDDADEDGEEEDLHCFSHGGQQKRMRSSEPWACAPSNFMARMEQIECLVREAKLDYAEKEQVRMNDQLEFQFMSSALQGKDQIIETLQKQMVDYQKQRDMEFKRVEHELRLMSNLVSGYRKALKASQNAFAEYRREFPQGDVPLYKDVPGSGGLVLSTMEYDKRCLERDKETFSAALEMADSIEKDWVAKFNGYIELFDKLHARLLALEEALRLLMEKRAKSKGLTAEVESGMEISASFVE